MKVWGSRSQGNPIRVAIFLEEKGIDIPFEPVDLRNGGHRTAAYLAKNPVAQVPVLELDDGTCISETVAICRYLERLYPTPPLMGITPLDEARIEMWQRRVELQFYDAVRAIFRHSNPLMKALEPVQIAEWAEINRPRVIAVLGIMNAQLTTQTFIAGPTFTIADITAVLAFQLLDRIGVVVPEEYSAVSRWRKLIFSRPSVLTIVGTNSANK